MMVKGKIALVLTASWAALAFSASAAAQNTTAATPQPDAASAPTDDVAEDIVVTGLRASLARAQDVKRRAPSVVEAITSQDLGKFTDLSIADAIQRLPGVSIERNYRGFSQGNGVNIRGLGREYVQATLNGRELLGQPDFFGGSGRNFDFGAIPPEVLGSVLVYKSPTANIVESGLAGEVDQRTIRPLDVKGKSGNNVFGSLTVAGEYDVRARDITPSISGLLGAKLFNDTLAVYVGGVYSREHFQIDQAVNYDGRRTLRLQQPDGSIRTVNNINIPNGFANENAGDQRLSRDSIAAGLQWRPSDRFELNADFLYSRYKVDIFQPDEAYLGPGFVGAYDGIALPGAVEIRGQDAVYVDTSKFVGAGGVSYQRAGFTHSVTPNTVYNYGLNAAWNDGNGFKVTLDADHQESEYFRDWRTFYGYNLASGGTNVIYDIRNSTLPRLTFSSPNGRNLSSPSSYTIDSGSFFNFEELGQNKRNEVALDFEKRVNDHLTLQAGGRYTNTKVDFRLAIGATTTAAVNPTGFFNGVQTPYLYDIALPFADEAAICKANPTYCDVDNRGRGSFAGDFPTSSSGKPGDRLGFASGSSYYIDETKGALYAQANYDGSVGALRLLGNIGLRAVHVKEIGKAFQGVTYRIANVNGILDPARPAVTQLVTDTNSYWKYLPSVNVTLKPADTVNIRLGAARTISLAQYQSLAPIGNATIATPDASGGFTRAVYNGGTSKLKPTSSWNYDITAEYYTPNGGAIIGSVFYKDVKDLVQSTSSVGTVPGQGTREFDITTTGNNASGTVYGAEIGFNQPLTFLPGKLSGLGIQANYTYAHTETKDPLYGNIPFAGNAQHSVNASMYYDKDGTNAQLSFNYRSKEFQTVYSVGNSRFIAPQYSLDFSMTQKLFSNFEARLNLVNLTGATFRDFASSSGRTENFSQRPTTVLVGLRATF